MIKGVIIERGYPEDDYSTYIRCDGETYPPNKEVTAEQPLTNNSITIFEAYNLLERVEIAIERTFLPSKRAKLEEYKMDIIQLIILLKSTSEPTRDDDECFDGKLKIPYGEYSKYVRINTYRDREERKAAIENVGVTLKRVKY